MDTDSTLLTDIPAHAHHPGIFPSSDDIRPVAPYCLYGQAQHRIIYGITDHNNIQGNHSEL